MKEKIKKLGAIVAGASILASSVAFAGGLLYQNTALVNEEGEPLAKVVVGTGAAAGDGVAAALISNAIVNEAYKTTTLTASTVGEAICDCGEGNECEIVENSETTTIRVSVPGATNGDSYFMTAIGDYVDKGLENRYTDSTDSDEAYTVYDDLEDIDANPFQNFVGDVMTDTSYLDEANMHQVSLGENTVVDSKANLETVEKQDAWIKGNVYWDEGEQELFGKLDFLAYRAAFDYTGDDGILLCTDEDTEWSDCNDFDMLESHNVKVRFMGEDWVISDIDNIKDGFVDSSATERNEIYAVDGATVKLAKESVSGVINVGEIMEAPSGYKVRLDDISRETGEDNEHPAIITVLDANDEEVCREQVSPGETKDDLCDTETGVRLHVYQTAPGLNFIAKWAEMAIYKDEIELESGNEFLDEDTEWEITLGWSNDDVGKDDPEYLREIVLSNSDLDDSEEMEGGDAVTITDVEEYKTYEIAYNGLENEDVEYDSLSFNVEKDKDFDIVYNTDGDECDVEDANGVEVTTDEEFRFGGKRGDTMWYIPAGEADITNCTPHLTGIDMIVMETTDGEYAFEIGGPVAVDYRWAGSQGYINFYPTGGWDYISLVENAGKYGNQDMVEALGFAYDVSAGELAEEYISATPDEDYIGYVTADEDLVDATGLVSSGIVPPFDTFSENGYESFERYEEGFLSMRGTEFESGSDSSYEFSVPGSLVKTSWTFSFLRDSAGEDGNIYILHEGDEQTVGASGIKIKVLSIDQEVSPCTIGTGAGEEPVCVPDMSEVGAVIMPANAPEVEAVTPYKITENLVYLDSDNVALDTGVIITVGGDAVNSVSEEVMEQGGIDLEATNVVVKQVGNKIVVAGYSAADTIEAAKQFISEME